MVRDGLFVLRTVSSATFGLSFRYQETVPKLICKIYSVVLAFSVFLLCVWCLENRGEWYDEMSYINVFLDVLVSLTLTIMNTASFIIPTFVQEKELVRYENAMAKIEKYVHNKNLKLQPKLVKFICCEQIFNFLVLAAFLTILIAAQITFHDMDHVIYNISNYINYVLMFLSVSRIYIFILSLKCKIAEMNAVMMDVYCPKEIQIIISHYDELFCAMKSLNKVFGFEILCLFGISEISLVQIITVHQEMEHHFNAFAYLISTLRYIIIIMYDIEVAFSADQVTDSLKTAGYLATFFMSKCSRDMKNYENITNGYRLIANQVKCRNIHITAGGFFRVDRSIVFKVFGQVSGYIIVVLQFQKMF